MLKAPPEKTYTAGQLRRRVRVFRLGERLAARATGAWHSQARRGGRLAGRELFLETTAGRVRVLAYGLENPEVLPLFVNIHGGGFVMGSAEMDDPFLPGVAVGAGVKTVNVDYSLAPEHPFPSALDQCYAVVKYAKEHAGELAIDPERIAVGGHSAGGNLSAGICLLDVERQELGLKALILDYPPLDLHTDPYLKPRPKGAIPPWMARMFDAAYYGKRVGGTNPLVSPSFASIEQVCAFPPTLIISASEDSLAAEETVFKEKLESTGVPVTYRLFQGCRHGFTHLRVPEALQAWQLMTDYLREHLAR